MMLLRDKDGQEITKESEILDYVYSFYTDLYSQPPVPLAESREQENAPSLIGQLVTAEENRHLREAPGPEELKDTVKNLPLEKSPGEDGLPIEVLRELWEETGTGCLHFVQEAWKNKRIGKYNSGAVIKLIPNNSRKEDLKNWCPLSLLNLGYKLISRILANHLKDIIPKLIDEEKTGFIQGRSITDNIVSLGLCQDLANA
ncbi:hypothetical protein R1flu_020815 [Riccia fluitans]|uniref:Reverse transcriptase domain-containing protein n=1 Tax=Riccia fluitans TaxID=41844 RepID=A0ABD1ZNS0_9MARC